MVKILVTHDLSVKIGLNKSNNLLQSAFEPTNSSIALR